MIQMSDANASGDEYRDYEGVGNTVRLARRR